METQQKSRFPVILLGSAVLHGAVLAALYGSWVYGVALKFGSIRWESGGEAKYKVADIDRTKPLFLPKGFYAVQKPPEEIAKREKEPTTDDKEKARRKDEKKDEKKDETAEDQKPEEPPKDEPQPAATGTFGKISGGALKPHLQQIYRAYEQGRLTTDAFTVTVACKAQPDGSLTDIKLAKSSGDELIDKTAVNIVKEIGAMRALGPLARLSSLSITLQKTPTASSLTAVGFATDPDVTTDFANQLGFLKMASRFKMENDDQRRLLDNVQIASSGNRVSVTLGLPTSVAGDMMRKSFGQTAQVTPGT
jgi:TonB family protein